MPVSALLDLARPGASRGGAKIVCNMCVAAMIGGIGVQWHESSCQLHKTWNFGVFNCCLEEPRCFVGHFPGISRHIPGDITTPEESREIPGLVSSHVLSPSCSRHEPFNHYSFFLISSLGMDCHLVVVSCRLTGNRISASCISECTILSFSSHSIV